MPATKTREVMRVAISFFSARSRACCKDPVKVRSAFKHEYLVTYTGACQLRISFESGHKIMSAEAFQVVRLLGLSRHDPEAKTRSQLFDCCRIHKQFSAELQ